jgi:hypothetical protein
VVSATAATVVAGAAVAYGVYSTAVAGTELVTGKEFMSNRELSEEEYSNRIGAVGVAVVAGAGSRVFVPRARPSAPVARVEPEPAPTAEEPPTPASPPAGQNAVPTGSRLARDVAVDPVPPAPMSLNRPVGLSPSQNQAVQTRIANLQAQGASDMRVNQQQVNAAGQRVGVNRPDLQYTLNGRRFYEEFDTPTSGRGPGHESRLLANDPAGTVTLFVVP